MTPEQGPTGGLTPHISIGDRRAREAVDFYERAFAAERAMEPMPAQDGERIMHAHLRINGGSLMLADDFPEHGHAPQTPGAVMLHLQVDDADAWFDRAVTAGATPLMPPTDMFWGDRYGQIRDPFGHSWSIGSPITGEAQ
jgi:PhnB protein